MKSTYATLMQSRFFTPAFNSALFDGPIRIYFSQFHESMALKIYFGLQQNYSKEMEAAKSYQRTIGKNILVMLYPNDESFKLSFETASSPIEFETLEDDCVIGVNGPIEDETLSVLLKRMTEVLESWRTEVEIQTEISSEITL